MKQMPVAELAELVKARLTARGVDIATGPDLEAAVALFKDRCNTLDVLADWGRSLLCRRGACRATFWRSTFQTRRRPALADFAAGIATVAWEAPAINALIKDTVTGGMA